MISRLCSPFTEWRRTSWDATIAVIAAVPCSTIFDVPIWSRPTYVSQITFLVLIRLPAITGYYVILHGDNVHSRPPIFFFDRAPIRRPTPEIRYDSSWIFRWYFIKLLNVWCRLGVTVVQTVIRVYKMDHIGNWSYFKGLHPQVIFFSLISNYL